MSGVLTGASETDDPLAVEALTHILHLDFYARQAGRRLGAADAVSHFRATGERAGFSPHPLLSPTYVAAQLQARSEPCEGGTWFSAYLKASRSGDDFDPHPLFDARYYLAQAGAIAPGVSALEHYVAALGAGRTPPSPSLLFDRGHFGKSEGELCGLLDYLTNPSRFRRSPHPLFDSSVFVRACAEAEIAVPEDVPLLQFYVTSTQSWACKTHSLFDPSVFSKALTHMGKSASADLPPLACFLSLDEDIQTHALFDPRFYRMQAALKGVSLTERSVLHHLRHRGQSGLAPHPFFSPEHYIATYPDVARSRMDPLQHFIRHGRFELRSPHPLIFLRGADGSPTSQVLKSGDDAFDFIAESVDRGAGVADSFDADLYAARHGLDKASPAAVLRRFIEDWTRRGVVCPPWGTALHERRPGATNERAFDLVVVSHELTRTGAPLILLALVRHFTQSAGLSCLVMARRGGVLLEAFREWADVLDLSQFGASDAEAGAFALKSILSFDSAQRPRAALVNTACADTVGAALAGAGLKVITLVHELAAAFDKAVFENIYAASSAVIYPAEFVRREAHATFDLPVETTTVRPQGLLKPSFGAGDRRQSRRDLLEQLDAPDDAFIVLGCGTMDLRKGVDLFASVALAALKANGAPDRPLYFCWAGGGPTHRHSLSWYVAEDADRAGVGSRLQLIGPRVDTEKLFLASDAFLLTSRQDPFPCVIHEAMACGLPIVAFGNSGGAPEALDDDAGIVVPYADTNAMTEALLDLLRNPTRARRLGARARKRVAQRYNFAAYGEAILEEFGLRAGVRLARTPPPARLDGPAAAPRRRVVFATKRALSGSRGRSLGGLLRGLQARGFDADIVYIGPISALASGPKRRSPVRLLARSSRVDLTGYELQSTLCEALGAAGPAVLVCDGPEVTPGLDALPKDVCVVGVVDDADLAAAGALTHALKSWSAAVVLAENVRADVVRLDRRMAAICEVIAPSLRPNPAPVASSAKHPVRLICAMGGLAQERDLRGLTTLIAFLSDVEYSLVILVDPQDLRTVETLFQTGVAGARLAVVAAADDDALHRALAQAEIYIALGDETDAGVSVDEAMGAGLAIVNAARSRKAHAWRRNDGAGVVVARGDLRAVADAVRALAADRDQLFACRLRARERVQERLIRPDERLLRWDRLLNRMFDEMASSGRVGGKL